MAARAACEVPGPFWMHTILGNVKRSRDGTYHALGPNYLAEFQYRFNRRNDLAALLRRMLQAAATALPQPRPILMSRVAQRSPLPPAVRNPAGARNSPAAAPHHRQMTAHGIRRRALPPASKAVRAQRLLPCLTVCDRDRIPTSLPALDPNLDGFSGNPQKDYER